MKQLIILLVLFSINLTAQKPYKLNDGLSFFRSEASFEPYFTKEGVPKNGNAILDSITYHENSSNTQTKHTYQYLNDTLSQIRYDFRDSLKEYSRLIYTEDKVEISPINSTLVNNTAINLVFRSDFTNVLCYSGNLVTRTNGLISTTTSETYSFSSMSYNSNGSYKKFSSESRYQGGLSLVTKTSTTFNYNADSILTSENHTKSEFAGQSGTDSASWVIFYDYSDNEVVISINSNASPRKVRISNDSITGNVIEDLYIREDSTWNHLKKVIYTEHYLPKQKIEYSNNSSNKTTTYFYSNKINNQIDPDGDSYYGFFDCDETNLNINVGQTEIPYNGLDDDCNVYTRDDDVDGDGFLLAEDCNDNNYYVNPGQTEIPYNGFDDDCDIETIDDDIDGDGFLLAEDCDDNNYYINPAAIEDPTNFIDEDCDGEAQLIPGIYVYEIGYDLSYFQCLLTNLRIEYESAQNLTSYLWNFGENALPQNSNEQGPHRVIYTRTGVKYITLEIKDSSGLIQTIVDTIEIIDKPTGGWDHKLINETDVKFTPMMDNADTFEWDFGDSQKSTLASPTHNYDEPGFYYVTMKASNFCNDKSIVKLINTQLSKIESENSYQEISIFPNPSNGIFQLKLPSLLETVDLKILDINGKLCWSSSSFGSQQIQIELPELSSGSYILRLSHNGKVKSIPFVMNRE